MAHKPKTKEPEKLTPLTPLLVPIGEVCRLLSSPESTVEQLIREGHLTVRTVADKTLVRLRDVLGYVERDDPEPVPYPPQLTR
jgi:hypothetical protein